MFLPHEKRDYSIQKETVPETEYKYHFLLVVWNLSETIVGHLSFFTTTKINVIQCSDAFLCFVFL